MKAVILAGGKGTRLKPYTITLPKPLVPVGEKPILELLINKLKSFGINEVVICVNHMAELIMSYFGDGHRFGVNIQYSIEESPLKTVAPIKLIKDLPQNFLVMNGDVLTDLDLIKLFNFHLEKKSMLTVATYTRNVKIDFGVIDINEKDRIAIGFREKPEYTFDVSMGVYVFNKKVLEAVPESQPFGFDDLMHELLNKNEKIQIYKHNGYWLDIGRPEDYEKANEDISRLRI